MVAIEKVSLSQNGYTCMTMLANLVAAAQLACYTALTHALLKSAPAAFGLSLNALCGTAADCWTAQGPDRLDDTKIDGPNSAAALSLGCKYRMTTAAQNCSYLIGSFVLDTLLSAWVYSNNGESVLAARSP